MKPPGLSDASKSIIKGCPLAPDAPSSLSSSLQCQQVGGGQARHNRIDTSPANTHWSMFTYPLSPLPPFPLPNRLFPSASHMLACACVFLSVLFCFPLIFFSLLCKKRIARWFLTVICKKEMRERERERERERIGSENEGLFLSSRHKPHTAKDLDTWGLASQ